jgi:hypothetical protein
MVYRFHAVLISAGILLAAALAARELLAGEEGGGSRAWALLYAALTAALSVYLYLFARRRWGRRDAGGRADGELK